VTNERTNEPIIQFTTSGTGESLGRPISGQSSPRLYRERVMGTTASLSSSEVEGEHAAHGSPHRRADLHGGSTTVGSWVGQQFGNYQLRGWRIVIRLITNTTNMRTLIGGVSPQVGLGNSMSAVNLVEEGPQ
jgi:hypothetical protein